MTGTAQSGSRWSRDPAAPPVVGADPLVAGPGRGLSCLAEGSKPAVGEHTGSGWVGKACPGVLSCWPAFEPRGGLAEAGHCPGPGVLTPQVRGGARRVPVSQLPR